MRNLIIFLAISILFAGCSSKKITVDNSCFSKEDVQIILESEIKASLNKYPFYLDNEVFVSPSKKINIESLLKGSSLSSMTRINIKTKGENIDFTSLFSEEDFKYMRCQLNQGKAIKDWKPILHSKYFKKNYEIKRILNKNQSIYDILKSKNKEKILEYRKSFFKYSLPLFNKLGDYALIYRENRSSGDLWLLKKENNQWSPYAVLSLWTSD